MTDYSGIQILAKQDASLVRMNGLLLAVLVGKGILTNAQARELIDDVITHIPDQNAAWAQLLHELKNEFP